MQRVVSYFRNSLEELKQVTWISKMEAQRYTISGALFISLLALSIFGIDFIFQQGINYLLGIF